MVTSPHPTIALALLATLALAALAATAPPKTRRNARFTARNTLVPGIALTGYQAAPTIFGGTEAPSDVARRTIWLHACFNGPPPAGRPCGALCSGSVITPRVIMTAAHCLYIGGRFATSSQVTYLGEIYDAKSIHVASRYVTDHVAAGQSLIDDIAIVKLRTRLPGTARDIKYKLPTKAKHVPRAGQKVYAAGHGLTDAASGTSPTLMLGDTRMLGPNQCRGFGPRGFICTDTARDSGVLCPGDSGGPLFRRLKNGLRIVGVNSAILVESFDANGNLIENPTFVCGDANTAHIYANVFNYLADIRSCFRTCSAMWQSRNMVYRYSPAA